MAVLKWTGIGMLAIAVFLGALALRVRSHRTEPSAEPVIARVLIAQHALRAGDELRGRDLALANAENPPNDAMVDLSAAIGRSLAAPLADGAVLRESQLVPLGALARGLREGETAVAVEVDGVTGLGGFVRPGDAVDVLFLLRRDGREVRRTQARTLLQNVRVLAFGTKLEDARSDEPTLNARTAVLAVRADDAPTLLLADVVGTLRLALRQASVQNAPQRYPTASLEELLGQERRPQADEALIPIIRGGRTRSGEVRP